jgi:hypothetical protein
MTRPSARRVASRYLRAASEKRVTGSARDEYLDPVWDMYAKTYAKIGMHIRSPQILLSKYPIWDLTFDQGVPIAFTLYKQTPFGLKSGLSGQDGSPAGRKAAIHNLRTKFREGGVFGEVSHKVKDIALASGAPVVCAAYADDVTGKQIEIDPEDPISYLRVLEGVGPVKKTLVGRPKGVPVTSASNALSCPTVNIDLGDPWPPTRTGSAAHSLLGWGSDVTPDEEAMYDLCAYCSDLAMSELDDRLD